MRKIKLIHEPNLRAKLEAFSFQDEVVNSLKDLDYSAIFLEQGLGKSKVAIDLMLYWLENNVIDTVLFVVKKALISNWTKEFEKHTYVRPRILSQNPKVNFYAFNSPSRLMLMNYEVLIKEKERLKLFLKSRNVGVILDESAKIRILI